MVSNSAARTARGSGAPKGGDGPMSLLERYRLRPSKALFDRVIELHRTDVEAMALGFASRLPRSVDARDLIHAGMWGLMQAISAFEPNRCERFATFMRIRVRGAMLDELRHMDFLPRLRRRRLRELDVARSRLRMELEREPTATELAAALGISEVALLLRRRDAAIVQHRRGNDGEADADQCEQLPDDGIESPIEALARRELIEQIRNRLAPMEWRVLKLHYLEGLTGKQVARRLRLSASRICQIHGRVLDRLKQQLIPAAV